MSLTDGIRTARLDILALKVFMSVIAVIAITSTAHGVPLQLTAVDDPAPSQPLSLDTAEQYLGDPNFYGQTWDPALMALATGSTDPAYRNIIDVRRFQAPDAFGSPTGNPHAAVALDAGPMACPGGFAIRTVDEFGQVRTVRITMLPKDDSSGQNGRFAKLVEMTEEDNDWAKQLVRFGQQVGRRHEVILPIGTDRLSLSAQLNSDRQATAGQEAMVNGGLTYMHGKSFSFTYNPTPLFDNQVVNRLGMVVGNSGASTHFTLRNVAWRRAASYLDSTQIDGGAWVAGASTALNPRSSMSAAVSKWSTNSQRGTDTIVTGEYKASANRVYGLGLMDSSGAVSPFASFATTLRGNGRLYLSFGAPLDDHTPVPVACRMSMGF